MSFLDGSVVKNLLAMQEMQEMQVQSLVQEDPLEEEMETRSSVLAGKIPWTEQPGGLQSIHRFAKSGTRLKRLSTAQHPP